MAGSGRKPDLKMTFKPAMPGVSGQETPFAAFWKEDGGRLSGGLDRKIVSVTIKYEDGTTTTVRRENGKSTHWCNLKDWSAGGGRSERRAPAEDDDGEMF